MDTYFRIIPKTFRFLSGDLDNYAWAYVIYLEKGTISLISPRPPSIWQIESNHHQEARTCSFDPSEQEQI